MLTDVFMTYQFLKRFVMPFTRWKAYSLGIIDADGKVLKKRSSLTTSEERAAFGTFDLLILNLKKILAKVPGGGSFLGAATAAVLLMKEDEAVETFAAIMEDSPTNSAGSGQVASIGQGPQGEPPMGRGSFKRVKGALKRKRSSRVWSDKPDL